MDTYGIQYAQPLAVEGMEAYFPMSMSLYNRARPDWAYEFPDQTGQDTQICRTGLARPD